MPLPEVILWSKLKNRRLCGYKFRRQHGIGNFVVDFYCPELKLAIEIDGDTHYTLESGESDRQRQAFIESYGIQFVRFTNKEVCRNLEGVTEAIAEWIKRMTTPTPP
jgi:very-short-patch-repair endonuclease